MTSHTRRGYTLVELMLAIVLASLALGSIAALLQGVWRANRAMQAHRGTMHSVQRLATQFRDDVHAGVSVEPDAEKLSIHLPQGKVVVYEKENGTVQRIVNSERKVVHRDAFDLPPQATISFEVAPMSATRLASLIVSYPLGTMQPELSDRRTLRIDAACGLACVPRSHAPRGNALPRRSASQTRE